MRVTSRYQLDPAPDANGEAASNLRRDGVITGVVIPGRVLEAEYEINGHTLLFVTHDIPYEEQLDILLVDAARGLLDRASLYRANTTGSFAARPITGEAVVTFDFFGTRPWQVHVNGRPRLGWPWPGTPGLKRYRGYRRWFDVKQV